MHIRDILAVKGYEVVVIDPSSTVSDLLKILRERNLGSVVVSADGSTIAGIVTERDIVRSLVDGTDFLNGPVSAIMVREVHTCTAGDTVQSLMVTMTERRIRHLPVVDDRNRLAGLVSIGDVVKSHISELQFERDELERYVTGFSSR